MVIKFESQYLEKLYTGESQKGKPKYSDAVITKFKKTVLILKNVSNTVELSKFRGLNFESLKGEKSGFFSVRVDKSYRLEFRITKDVIEIVHIEELSKHYQ
jgi:plasmid maintenance system killer protein